LFLDESSIGKGQFGVNKKGTGKDGRVRLELRNLDCLHTGNNLIISTQDNPKKNLLHLFHNACFVIVAACAMIVALKNTQCTGEHRGDYRGWQGKEYENDFCQG
jgi:hypothetical protein